MTEPLDPTGWTSHIPAFHRGVPWKVPARVATTANVTIATALNPGDVVDGKTLVAGDRVLVPFQTDATQNGLWVSGTTPTRAFDMDQDETSDVPAEEIAGAYVAVLEGTLYGGTLWRTTNIAGDVLGTDDIVFEQFAGSSTASAVSVVDAAGYFSGANVETVLAELGALVDGVTAHDNTGATETFAATTGVHTATLNANCAFTFTAIASGLASGMVLILTQDGTGSRLVTWPGSVAWPGGVAPTLSTAAGAIDVLTFISVDGGATWLGFYTGVTGSSLTIKDEGSSLATAATSIDFVGAAVTASGITGAKTVTIPWPTLDNLTDVTITSAATADRLRYNGSAWVNSALRWVPLTVFDPTTGNYLPLVDGSGNQIMAETL